MVIREGAAQIVLDADGDGKGDIDWPTKGKFENLVLGSGRATPSANGPS